MALILGIDPGTTCVGYAIIDGETGQLRAADCLRLRSVPDVDFRLDELRRIWDGFWQAGGIFARLVAEKSPVFIERTFTQGNFGDKALAAAGHILRIPAKRAGLAVIEVSPMTVKKALTGSGKATKGEMLAFVNERYQRTFETHDVADAIGIATYGLQQIRQGA